jgi:hypothetical protein
MGEQARSDNNVSSIMGLKKCLSYTDIQSMKTSPFLRAASEVTKAKSASLKALKRELSLNYLIKISISDPINKILGYF